MAHEQESKTYFQGKPVDGFVENHEHVSPVSSYVAVLVGLFVLTALTYGVSYADLGAASLPVAIIVAVIKATLVCMYFMHLRYDDPYHVFVFLSTLLFVGIFFAFTLFDVAARTRISEVQDTFFRRQYDGWSDAQNLKKPIPEAVLSGEVPHADGMPGAEPAGAVGGQPGGEPEAVAPAQHQAIVE